MKKQILHLGLVAALLTPFVATAGEPMPEGEEAVLDVEESASMPEEAPPPAPEESPATPPTPKEISSMVIIKTSKGDIAIKLFTEEAPLTVANFLQYVDDGHYKGTIFHRVINGFMIQGGGFDADLKQKSTRAPVKNEAANGLKNKRGTIAMARTSIPDSATSQFFINVVNNEGLNRPSPDGHGYCVFGEVTDGMDVVDAIKAVRTTQKGMMGDVPIETIEILGVERAD